MDKFLKKANGPGVSVASEACDESEGNADDETQELEETAGNDGPEKAVVRPRTRPQGMPRSRQRGTLVPVGWTPVRYNGEAHYRCPSTCETLTGEVRRCAYHCRKYLIEKHTVHDYSIAHEDDELAVPQEAPRLRTTEAVNARIQSAVALLAGELDIPFTKASSRPMYQFVCRVFDAGLSTGAGLRHMRAKNIIQPMSDNTIRNAMIRIAKEETERKMKNLCRSVGYVNMLVDSGTVLTMRNLQCIISNPWYPIDKVTLMVEEKFQGNADGYCDFFRRAVAKATKKRLIICGICTDGLSAQCSGLEMSLRSFDGERSLIRPIRCYAHLVNLVYVNTLSQCPELLDLMWEIECTISDLRKQGAVKFIGSKCPTFSKTRWIYAYDVLAWFSRHGKKIDDYKEHLGEEPLRRLKEFIMFGRLLLPLKAFSLYVEGSQAKLENIIPLVEYVMSQWRELWADPEYRGKSMSAILSELQARFLARMSIHNLREACAAYALSLPGREQIRMENVGVRTLGPELGIERSEDLESFIKGINRMKANFADDPGAPLQENDESTGKEDDCVETTDQLVDAMNTFELRFDGSSVAYRERLQTIMEVGVDERMKLTTIFRNIYVIAREYMTDQADKLDIDSEAIMEQFDLWLFGNYQNFSFAQQMRRGQNSDSIWRQAYADKDWRDFANLALMTISLPVSEADVERNFSEQKDITKQKMTRMGAKTLKARLNLHKSTSSRVGGREEDHGAEAPGTD